MNKHPSAASRASRARPRLPFGLFFGACFRVLIPAWLAGSLWLAAGGTALAQPAKVPLAAAAAVVALAGAPSANALPDGLEQQVRQLVLDGTRSLTAAGGDLANTVASAPGGVPGGMPEGAPRAALRVEVLVGALDPRLHLATCQRIEPYLGNGTRLWGATRVGLRCLQGTARWNVFLPVTVKVHGRALVAATALAAGSVLSAADLLLAEVDLAEDASPALTDGPLAVGRALQRALVGGQTLRQSQLKPRQWFAAGDTVRVLANGDGFRVSGEAVALTRGVEGEPARVRTEGGRVLTGMPAAERRIDLPL